MTAVAHAHHGRTADRRRLTAAFAISVVLLVIEVAGGILSGSLALLADAGHLASDVAALALSLVALWIVARPATAEKTFGFYRVEIVAALVNGATLMLIAGFIFAEALRRLRETPEVHGGLMMGVSALGLLGNVAAVLILARSRGAGLNLRSAFLHVLGDLLGSVAALAAALVILATGWTAADPLASAFIGIIIIVSAARLMRDSLNVLLEGVPRGMRYDEVTAAMRAVAGVTDLHDLHVWSITSDFPVLTSHVVLADGAEPGVVLRAMQEMLQERFGIAHATLQLETTQARQMWVCEGGRCYPVTRLRRDEAV